MDTGATTLASSTQREQTGERNCSTSVVDRPDSRALDVLVERASDQAGGTVAGSPRSPNAAWSGHSQPLRHRAHRAILPGVLGDSGSAHIVGICTSLRRYTGLSAQEAQTGPMILGLKIRSGWRERASCLTSTAGSEPRPAPRLVWTGAGTELRARPFRISGPFSWPSRGTIFANRCKSFKARMRD